MKYIILGASAAGISAAKTLRELEPSSEIVVISHDTFVYSRCMLHHLISGERPIEKLNFIEKDFFKNNNMVWISGKKIKKLNSSNKEILLDDNRTLSFDKLLIATGSSSFIPPVKNLREAKNVFGLRNLEDAEAIKEKSQVAKAILIIGAGLVGIDAALGLIEKDISISIVELSDRILPLQLDKKAAAEYENLFKEKAVQIITGTSVEEILVDEQNNVIGAKLNNGQKITCDMIVVAAGVRPNVDFIDEKEISLDRGIVINEKCETSAKDVYAAGDVCGRSPIWPIAVKQGKVAAYNMAGKEKYCDDNFAYRNSMNFLGLDTISIGISEACDESYSVDILDDNYTYKKIISKDGIIYGALLQGDTSYAGVLTYLIKNKIDISKINKCIFDIDYADFFNIKPNGEYEYITG
jgi:nitrite reductase (NADH) large subunit